MLTAILILGACSSQVLTAYSGSDDVCAVSTPKQTIQDLETRLSADPDDRKALNQRGRVYQSEKRFDLALTDFNRSLTLDPGQADIVLGRALIYQAQGLHTLAISELSRSIALAPDEAAAYQARASSEFAQNNMTQAISDYDLALARNDTLVEAWALRGLALEKTGARDRAQRSFANALKRDPRDPIARAGLTRLTRTDANPTG